MVDFKKPDIESIEQMIEISEICGISVWTEKDFRDEFARRDSKQLIAIEQEKVIGFAILRLLSPVCLKNAPQISFDEGEILNIAVDPRFQKKGIGKILLNMIINYAVHCGVMKVWLEVRESNNIAIDFYKKNHFERMNIRPNYYRAPEENALNMKLDTVVKNVNTKT